MYIKSIRVSDLAIELNSRGKYYTHVSFTPFMDFPGIRSQKMLKVPFSCDGFVHSMLPNWLMRPKIFRVIMAAVLLKSWSETQ